MKGESIQILGDQQKVKSTDSEQKATSLQQNKIW